MHRYAFLLFFLSACNNHHEHFVKRADTVITIPQKPFDQPHHVLFTPGSFLLSGDADLVLDVIDRHHPPPRLMSKGNTLYDDKDTIILGDKDKVPDHVYRHYDLKYNFEMFPVKEQYTATLAAPDLRTDPPSRMYRTMIREGCKQAGVNFAGHYTITSCGCGNECTTICVVDRISGRVYFSKKYLPFGPYIFQDVDFNANSRMIVVHADARYDFDHLNYYDLFREKPEYYKWAGNRFVRLKP